MAAWRIMSALTPSFRSMVRVSIRERQASSGHRRFALPRAAQGLYRQHCMVVRRGWGLLAAMVALASSREAQASPEDVFGFGPRTMAMGGAGAALGNGFEAV